MPNEQTTIDPGAAETQLGPSVSVQVNPEDSVPFRPEPVFISLGLKRDVFVGFSGGNAAPNPDPMGIPPVDLKTENGLLKAFLLLEFWPNDGKIR